MPGSVEKRLEALRHRQERARRRHPVNCEVVSRQNRDSLEAEPVVGFETEEERPQDG